MPTNLLADPRRRPISSTSSAKPTFPLDSPSVPHPIPLKPKRLASVRRAADEPPPFTTVRRRFRRPVLCFPGLKTDRPIVTVRSRSNGPDQTGRMSLMKMPRQCLVSRHVSSTQVPPQSSLPSQQATRVKLFSPVLKRNRNALKL